MCIENGFHHVGVHACSRWVGDNDVRAPVLADEVVGQNILHVAGIEQRVADAVNLRIDLGVLNGFGNIFNADNLFRLTGHEVCNGACARVKVVNQFAACKGG